MLKVLKRKVYQDSRGHWSKKTTLAYVYKFIDLKNEKILGNFFTKDEKLVETIDNVCKSKTKALININTVDDHFDKLCTMIIDYKFKVDLEYIEKPHYENPKDDPNNNSTDLKIDLDNMKKSL